MHPAPAGLGEPILVYRPSMSTGVSPATAKPQASDPEVDPKASSDQPSEINGQQSSISPTSPTLTPLPEIYAQAAPTLRCSSGLVNYCKLSDTSGIYLAFFEWDGTDTGSVLEAFRHVPEACMGAIGMVLVSKEKPIAYNVAGKTLLFEHTIFREPSLGIGGNLGSPPIHAFRAIWVSGLGDATARDGISGGDSDPLRTIRLEAAVNRYRPAHARVIQGAVRGLSGPDLAWQAFETNMLKDLSFVVR